MIFDTNPDGSTRNIYVQLSNFHGFAVVDWATRKEIARIEHPAVPGAERHTDGLQAAPAHGLGVSPDGKYIYVAAAGDNQVFVVDVKTMKEGARVNVGQVPKRNGTAILQVP